MRAEPLTKRPPRGFGLAVALLLAGALAGALTVPSLLGPGTASASLPVLGEDEGQGQYTPATPAQAGKPLFGFNDDWQDARDQLGYAKDAGGELIRFPVGWHKVQPISPLLWDWSFYDKMYEDALEQGLRIVFAPQNAPCWARRAGLSCSEYGGNPPDPDYLDEYAAFVRAAVERYPQLAAVEAWNEPNLAPYWNPAPSPEEYVPLLAATYTAVKATRPDMPVLFGGLAPVKAGMKANSEASGRRIDYRQFLGRAYELGAQPFFDALSIHVYVWSNRRPGHRKRAAATVKAAKQILAGARQVMAQGGDTSKDVWVTEIGLATKGRWAVSPQQQAELLPRLYDTLGSDAQVKAILFHRMFDGPDDAYGLIREDHHTRKPAYCAVVRWRGKSC